MNHQIDSSPLSVDSLYSMLSTKFIGRPIISYKEVSSTNTLGFEAAEADTPHGTVILAERQTAGKGRLGRTWHSPYGKNLYFSIVLTQTPNTSHVSWIPLLAGVALAESLELVSGLSISLKWPNDIMFDDKKLGGILCEGKQKGKGIWVCVVGIGINMNSEKDDFTHELLATATSLSIESHRQFNRHTFLATFLKNFESHYEQLLSSGMHDLRSQYILRCSTLQRSIQVRLVTGKQLEGFAVNIGNEGELQIAHSENREIESTISIRSGDVFHIR